MRGEGIDAAVPWWGRLGLSLRTVLVLAFTLQIGVVCTVVVWLTFSDGEQAVDEMATRLGSALTERVQERLVGFLRTPLELTEANAASWRLGVLDVHDADRVLRHLRDQLDVYPAVAYLSLGTADGRFIGAERRRDGSFLYHVSDADEPSRRYTCAVMPSGARGRTLSTSEDYDPRERPWYTAAVEADGITWRRPYTSFADEEVIYLTSVTPVKDQAGVVVGVFGAELFLDGANAFLKEVGEDTEGVMFISERDGKLIASSGPDAALASWKGGVVQLRVEDADDPLLQVASGHLAEASVVSDVAVLDLPDGSDRVFASFRAVADQPGLDWVIGVVLPEKALMEHIGDSRRLTLLLALAAILIALILGVWMGRSVSRPLIALAGKADRVRRGELDVTFPAMGARDEISRLSRSMAEMVQGLRDRDVIRDAFGRYVSTDMAEHLLENPSVLRLGGELRKVTILMSDLRGFTGLSEHMPPEELVGLLNSYLGAMTEVIVEHHGTIIEFIGDAILVVFGAPFPGEDDTERAVRCAIDMQLEMIDFNRQSAAAGLPELEMGIGLNTGEVVAGNIGSMRAAKYGVVGEAVNVAARIESLTVGTQILMSEATRQEVQSIAVLGRARTLRVKGVSTPLQIIELRGMLGDPPVVLTDQDEGMKVRVDLAARYQRVRGPRLEDLIVSARVCELGERGVDLVLSREIDALEKVCVRIELRDGVWSEDAYATVVDVAPHGERQGNHPRWRASAVFTSLTPAKRRALLREVMSQPDDA